MARSRPAALAVLAVLAAAPAFSAALVAPVGVEFQVNDYTTFHQVDPAIAMRPDGGFVVVWSSYEQDGFNWGIFARRFDSAGSPLDSEFAITTTPARQTYPTLAFRADDGFVVTWQSALDSGLPPDVFARRFDSSGEPQGSELQINVFTLGSQYQPEIAAGDAGFVVMWQSLDVWTDPDQDGDGTGLFARFLDVDGNPLGEELQVNSFTTGAQRHSSVSMAADGGFVVAWANYDLGGSYAGVFARRFDAAGTPQADEFQVNDYTFFSQSYPDVAHDPAGGFVIVWESEQDGPSNALGIFARRYDSLGTALGVELQVNAFTLGSERHPSVTPLGDSFVVAWEGFDGNGTGISARRVGASGAPEGGEFQVNTHTVGLEERPFAAGSANGKLVIAWDSDSGDFFGGDLDVFARFYAEPAPLDADANGTARGLTDGLLVLRFLFGFTDSTLTGGAVDADCMRCDDADIEAHVYSLDADLDVDGDGTVGALTDGILVLRFLSGFSGPALVAGAVAESCTRCDAADIAAYLEGLV